MDQAPPVSAPDAPGHGTPNMRASNGARLLGPALVVAAAAAVLAVLAALAGWYRDHMLALAVGAGIVTSLLAVSLVYRQRAEQRLAQRALQDVETRIGDVLNSAMDAIITVDHEQRIVLFNDAAERVFHWPRTAVLNQPLDILIPARFRDTHRVHVRQFGDTGVTSRRMGGTTVLTGLRATGEEFPVEASISQFGDGRYKLYTVILRDITLRVQAEQALRRSREELHELATAANHLREQERRRIARELHDDLAQALTGLKMDIAWIQDKLPVPPAPIGEKLRAMEALLDGAVAATRRISADLRPMMLDDLGLVPAMEWLVQNFTERTGIQCRLDIADPELELQDPHATTVFRIVQEALTNITKHARASNVEIVLANEDEEIVVRIRDDGVGFSPQEPRKPNSYGLVGLRERAYLVGGKVEIASSPGKGTRIEARLPFRAGAA